MLKELFQQKQQYLHHFFESINLSDAEKFLGLLRDCPGILHFTGVGKSGLVAKKIAVTMTSTGSRALYLSPTDALHGDLGILTPQDLFIVLSKSGETDELLNLVPFLRNRGVKLLGIVSNPKSRLAKACDFAITLPLARELCPFNMAPTTSTSIQLIFGDIMAIALMRQRNFSLDQYASNHPAGNIGKKAIIRVSDLMLRGAHLPLCSPQDKIMDILVELSNKRSGCILVVDHAGVLQGIFTDGDLRRALLTHGAGALERRIQELMISSPKWITAEKLAWDAMQLMEGDLKNSITALPVLDENKKVIGLIRLHDIVQAGL